MLSGILISVSHKAIKTENSFAWRFPQVYYIVSLLDYHALASGVRPLEAFLGNGFEMGIKVLWHIVDGDVKHHYRSEMRRKGVKIQQSDNFHIIFHSNSFAVVPAEWVG